MSSLQEDQNQEDWGKCNKGAFVIKALFLWNQVKRPLRMYCRKNLRKKTIASEEQEAVVAGITNVLYDKAKKKRQDIDEGTDMIEDSDGRFFNFLKGLGETYERISLHKIGDNMSQHYVFDLPEGFIKASNKVAYSMHLNRTGREKEAIFET